MSQLDISENPLLDQAARWGEEDDPEKTVRELFGYRISPDVRKAYYALEESSPRWVVTYGAHSSGKTHTVGAAIFGHYWYARGARLAADGRPRGALMVLLANKQDQIQKTSWKAVREHAHVAAERGHSIVGYERVPPVGVSWRADESRPLHWAIVEQSFRPPAASATRLVQSAEAGLHHPEGVIAWIEEIDLMRASMWNTVRKWGLSTAFGAFNPYVADPAVQAMLDGDEWADIQFSALRLPHVIERDASAIPGCVTHLEIEQAMR
ncbi:MAG: hypothetical protein O7A04_03475, partial [Acidobacteria bacterium]|nr:hypothetical protein [Acidobacteriota bacterium]